MNGRLTTGLMVFLLVGITALSIHTWGRLQPLEDRINAAAWRDVASLSPEETDLVAAAALEEANYATDLAFNLLGLFEALSLAVTIGGVVLTAFGFTRFNSAQNELTETRQRVEREFEEYRRKFEKEIEQREEELRELRTALEASAEAERHQTSNALLANALIPLGERQYKAADYDGALNTYHRALELDPKNPVVNQRLGYVYSHKGELDRAKERYEEAIEREADFAPALAGLGFVYRLMGDDYNKLLKGDLSPDKDDKLRMQRDKLYNQAEDYLLRALEISPRLVDDDGESWWGVLGGLYKRRGQIDQAINAYKKVTEVTPQSSYGLSNLALLYMRQNEREKMIQTYKRVEGIARTEAQAEQGNFWGYADLVTSSFAIGEIEQANEALEIAISIAPDDSPYMLSGMMDTLEELTGVLEGKQVPPIRAAIERLEEELAMRQQHQPDTTNENEEITS